MGRPDAAMLGAPAYERNENDFYPTEAACTEALVKYLRSNSLIADGDDVLEPACGDGAITKVFQKHGFEVASSDLFPQLEGAAVKDYLTHPFHEQPGWRGAETVVVTNPPYLQPWRDHFVRRTIELVREQGVVGALLMRNDVDCGSRQKRFFDAEETFYGKLVLTWRPRWIPGSTGSPRHNYAWYIWAPQATYTERQGPVIAYGFKG